MGCPEGTFDTKLHEAVRNGVLEEVKEALKQGYDPNLIGLFQWNPMHEAAENGYTEILKLLIKKKGDPNKPDYIQGKTPMHYATEKGQIDCLKLLIDCGGRYDIKDEMGKDCLDLCTPVSRKMLERLKIRDLMLQPDSDSVPPDKDHISLSYKSTDQHSLKSSVDSDTTSRKSSISSTQEKQPVIGYLHMSVEYHSAKQTLKVRIWQLTDILLPPPHTSGIHSIYIKSLLLPDKKKETKRKTEDIRVDTSEAHVQWKDKSSHQHVFMPSTFKFKRALEYNKINSELVKERNLQIEVCITQRYSHRSFLIGMLNMTLRRAVKKVVREKFPLIPCMNHTIPSNMKVYCASELDITSNKVFYSTPNVKINLPDMLDDSSDKAASNPDLQPGKYSPSVEVNMDNVTRAIVPKLNLDDAHLDESGYSSEFHMSMPSELDSPDSDKGIMRQPNVGKSKSPLRSQNDSNNGKVSKVLEGVKEKLTRKTRAVTKMENGIEITDLDEEEPVSISVETDIEVSKDTILSINHDGNETSRPETPTWDYYDVPTDIVTVDAEPAPTPWKEGAAPVVLPMETNLSIHHSNSKDNVSSKESLIKESVEKTKDKVRKKSKKKNAPPVPGRAIPLVPEIIVVNTDDSVNIAKSESLPETQVTVPDSDKQVLPEVVIKGSANADLIDHVVEIKEGKTGIVNIKSDIDIPLRKGKDVKNVPVKSVGEARALCVIEPSEAVESNIKGHVQDTNQDLPVVRPRTRKLRKMKEGGTKSGLVTQKVKSEQSSSVDSISVINSNSAPKTGSSAIATKRSEHNSNSELHEVKVISSEESSSKKGTDTRNTNSASFIVDMDKLSFANSGAHVVELEDDISITELSDNSILFSEASVISSTSVDMESGMESYNLPERVSPTKYMIPMQVYMDDDTSCDESLPTDRSDRSITILDVPKSSSNI